MRMSLLSALPKVGVKLRGLTWTGRINGDGTVIHYPTSFGRLGLHENECLFCALLVSSSSKGVERDVQEQQP
jgi:hypothetical protein